jgi:thiol-disulfide isomerase/thioredoxin
MRRLSLAALTFPLVLAPTVLGQAAPALPLSRTGSSPTTSAATTPVEAAIQEFTRLQQELRKEGKPYNAQVASGLIDTAFEQINISKLSVAHIKLIVGRIPVQTNAAFAKSLDDRLVQLSETPGQGVAPLATRLQLAGTLGKEDVTLELLTQLLDHPELASSLKAGAGVEVFTGLTRLTAQQQLALAPKYTMVASFLTSEVPDRVLMSVGGVFSALPRQLNRDQLATYSALREAVLAQIGERQGSGKLTPEQTAPLERLREQLTSAFSRGELIGYAAPPIKFDWAFNPSDPSWKISSLEDLKGKVVVLDFWATWCGPCIASFPNVRELQKHYAGHEVVILGVTSLQGYHVSPTGRVDTKGNPDKEYALMPEFIAQREMTWPVVFSSKNVFNPDYGVTGIPSVVIIDPTGKVRHAGLHPASPLASKTAMIDALLKEAGLPTPVPPTATGSK